eukprot:Hpha_TRINITY_DN23041_c0_g1::TRINITY_DN23041_c0_g1_i1::g.109396::m.109396
MPLGSAARAARPQERGASGRFRRALTAEERAFIRAEVTKPEPSRAQRGSSTDARTRVASALEAKCREAVRSVYFQRIVRWAHLRKAARRLPPSPMRGVGYSPCGGTAAINPLELARGFSPQRRLSPRLHRGHDSPVRRAPSPSGTIGARSHRGSRASPHRVRCPGSPPKNDQVRSYAEMGGTQRHTIRCHITADLLSRLVRKQNEGNDGSPREIASVKVLKLHAIGRGEQLTRLENLAPLKSIEELVSTGQLYTQVEGLYPLHSTLRSLDLSGNRIIKLDGLAQLDALTRLDLSSNLIERIPRDAFPRSLVSLSLARNSLCLLEDFHHLRPLLNLRDLDCSGNPISAHQGYRGVAVYTALSVEVFDGVTVSKVERDAAIYHWDRKNLKPLEAELEQRSSEAMLLSAQVEELKRENEQYTGQLRAVSGLLDLSKVERDELREEKMMAEAALRERDRALADTQVELLQTKSDLDFLRLEVETVHPVEATGMIQRTTGTLRPAASAAAAPPPPPPP